MIFLELDSWTGNRFTDSFTLLKTDGKWKIITKVTADVQPFSPMIEG